MMWRRIDVPGHEVARFETSRSAYRIQGYAAYREEGRKVGLSYSVSLHPDWTTAEAHIAGHANGDTFEYWITRTESSWFLNDQPQPGVAGIPHLDLGFTPATNMGQLRHAGLAVGEACTFDVAWFDVGRAELERLPQNYRRTGELEYAYDSPQGGYSANLLVGRDGFSTVYPGLWERVVE